MVKPTFTIWLAVRAVRTERLERRGAVVPVAVTGMYDVMRKGSYLLRPGYDVTVYVERPIPTAGLRDDEIPALAAEVQRVVAARVDDYWREKAARGRTR